MCYNIVYNYIKINEKHREGFTLNLSNRPINLNISLKSQTSSLSFSKLEGFVDVPNVKNTKSFLRNSLAVKTFVNSSKLPFKLFERGFKCSRQIIVVIP